MAAPTQIVAQETTTSPSWGIAAKLWLVALAAAGLVVGLYAVGGIGIASNPMVLWLCVTIFLVAALAIAGHALTGRFLGALITENNVMSASRAQALVWFIAIVSTYVVLWVLNFRQSPADNVVLTQGALVATVAASGSLVGAQLLNSPKADRIVDEEKLKKAVPEFRDQKAERRGALWRNPSVKDARVKDIFEGDEVVDGASLDAGKVQMLVLTLILACMYVLKFLNGLGAEDPPNAVPDIDASVATLLGLSHAGYLGNKLPDRTKLI